MIDKKIVTCFIEHNDKLLILRRSNKVGTYRGKWASVSGHIEGGEDEHSRALIEIEEETKLKRTDVKLLAKSKPIIISDKENSYFWKVYPFLFKTYRSDIKIDWEHIEYKWISPTEFDKFDTVPMLYEVYKKIRKNIQY
ncbi:MAG: NUDIX pyrophosphatase [Candidatus Bathyarchaeota archaeon]|nr:NUDIX pyrophosphatase [Candidatus Bathyarchaeota archaeon]